MENQNEIINPKSTLQKLRDLGYKETAQHIDLIAEAREMTIKEKFNQHFLDVVEGTEPDTEERESVIQGLARRSMISLIKTDIEGIDINAKTEKEVFANMIKFSEENLDVDSGKQIRARLVSHDIIPGFEARGEIPFNDLVNNLLSEAEKGYIDQYKNNVKKTKNSELLHARLRRIRALKIFFLKGYVRKQMESYVNNLEKIYFHINS